MSVAGCGPASETVSCPWACLNAPVPPVIACVNGVVSSCATVTRPEAAIWPAGQRGDVLALGGERVRGGVRAHDRADDVALADALGAGEDVHGDDLLVAEARARLAEVDLLDGERLAGQLEVAAVAVPVRVRGARRGRGRERR